MGVLERTPEGGKTNGGEKIVEENIYFYYYLSREEEKHLHTLAQNLKAWETKKKILKVPQVKK